MKIYIVKILNDINNNYQGIDDTEIYAYNECSKAEKRLAEEYEKTMEFFKDKRNEKEENLSIESNTSYFHVNNDNDYITGVIEELEVL